MENLKSHKILLRTKKKEKQYVILSKKIVYFYFIQYPKERIIHTNWYVYILYTHSNL